jgi:membrane associated rhomboid family serine protease
LTENHEPSWVEVGRFRDLEAAHQHALVLVAAGIDCRIVSNDKRVAILVEAGNAAAAFSELAAYAADNRRTLGPRLRLRPAGAGLAGALIFCCVLLFVYGAAEREIFSRDWEAAGDAQAGLIVDGEWWRALTALGLHGDYGHLFANIIAGAFLGIVLSQILGGGFAWFLIVLAGGLGNIISALFQSAGHTAIGASTAVFGALGILAIQMTRYQGTLWRQGLRRWAPVGAGVMLLTFLGTGGERIDVGGHVAGFVAGSLIGGVLLAVGEPAMEQEGRAQYALGAAALALFAGAWLLAF